MPKKYIVCLSDAERNELRTFIKNLSGNSQKVRLAQILFEVDANGSNWTDERIADAFDYRTQTVEKIRKRLVKQVFRTVLNSVKRQHFPTKKLLGGANKLT